MNTLSLIKGSFVTVVFDDRVAAQGQQPTSAVPCGTPWAGSAGPSARQGRIPEVGGSVRAGAVPGLGIGPRY